MRRRTQLGGHWSGDLTGFHWIKLTFKLTSKLGRKCGGAVRFGTGFFLPTLAKRAKIDQAYPTLTKLDHDTLTSLTKLDQA